MQKKKATQQGYSYKAFIRTLLIYEQASRDTFVIHKSQVFNARKDQFSSLSEGGEILLCILDFYLLSAPLFFVCVWGKQEERNTQSSLALDAKLLYL